MESIVEDVEDQRQTEGSPANSQSCKKFSELDVVKPSSRVHQSGVFGIHDNIDSEAR